MRVILGVFLLLYIGWGVRSHWKLSRDIKRRSDSGRVQYFTYTGADAALNILLWDPLPRVPVCLAISYGVNLLLGGDLVP